MFYRNFSEEFFDSAFAAIPKSWLDFKPSMGLILGSGWSRSVLEMAPVDSLSFSSIPGYGDSTVKGHLGEVRLIEVSGHRSIVFCGRRHFYEGVGWAPVVLPIEIMRRLGVSELVLTNAAGGVNPNLKPGDLLTIKDHVNTVGVNPLQGPVIPGWGPRFPDQSEVYSSDISASIHTTAKRLGIELGEGVYAYTMGPCFETPSEIRAYAIWQADVVGMSTVPEAIVANAIGMKTVAISCVTNMAAGISREPLSHNDVIKTSEMAAAKMNGLVMALLSGITSK